MHAVTVRADDGAVFNPQWAVACHRTKHAQYAFGQGLHDGAVVQGRGLRDGHLRQVAPRHRAPSLPGAHGFDEFYGIPPDTS